MLEGQHVEKECRSWMCSRRCLWAVVDHLSKSRTSCQTRAINSTSRKDAEDITAAHSALATYAGPGWCALVFEMRYGHIPIIPFLGPEQVIQLRHEGPPSNASGCTARPRKV